VTSPEGLTVIAGLDVVVVKLTEPLEPESVSKLVLNSALPTTSVAPVDGDSWETTLFTISV
jgi:hypothetical protein